MSSEREGTPRFIADNTEEGSPMVLDTARDPHPVVCVCHSDGQAERIAALLNAGAVTTGLCSVCRVLPARDGYCHGCALDCIEGQRAAIYEACRIADGVRAEERAATLREVDEVVRYASEDLADAIVRRFNPEAE